MGGRGRKEAYPPLLTTHTHTSNLSSFVGFWEEDERKRERGRGRKEADGPTHLFLLLLLDGKSH